MALTRQAMKQEMIARGHQLTSSAEEQTIEEDDFDMLMHAEPNFGQQSNQTGVHFRPANQVEAVDEFGVSYSFCVTHTLSELCCEHLPGKP
jgi:hypothetical protein